ncbi:hypothetical protein [Corynebacterium sp. 335C]
MTTWDSTIFAAPAAAELLEEIDAIDDAEERAESLAGACRLGAADADRDEAAAGLAAATVAAIWCGAPFSATDVIDDHPFIRAGIGSCPEDLREAAAEAFEALTADLPPEDAEAAEEFAEAVN